MKVVYSRGASFLCWAQSESDAAVTSVAPRTNYDNGALRTLIAETFSIFARLHELSAGRAAQGGSIGADELLVCSQSYLAALKAASESVDGSERQSDVAACKYLRAAEIVWCLAERLYFKPNDASVAADVLCFAHTVFRTPDNHLAAVQQWNAQTGQSIEKCDQYWWALYALIAFGRFPEARQLLALHPYANSPAYKSLDYLLQKAPVESLLSAGPRGGVVPQWQTWQADCGRRVASKHFVSDPPVELAVSLLAGEQRALSELHTMGVLPQWYELLVAHVLYTRHDLMLHDLAEFVPEELRSETAIADGAEPLDVIVARLFGLDVVGALKACVDSTSDWWLAAHLADMLKLAEHPDLHESKAAESECGDTADLRHFLVVEYASSLALHPDLWNFALMYLRTCGQLGAATLEHILERMPCRDDRDRLRIINASVRVSCAAAGESHARVRCLSAVRRAHWLDALSWAAHCGDRALVASLAAECMRHTLVHVRSLADVKRGAVDSLAGLAAYIDSLAADDARCCTPLSALRKFIGLLDQLVCIDHKGEGGSQAECLSYLLQSEYVPPSVSQCLLQLFVQHMQRIRAEGLSVSLSSRGAGELLNTAVHMQGDRLAADTAGTLLQCYCDAIVNA